MKSILLSIKPEWLAKILNGKASILVRKLFPKDYVGWVYLYCGKSKPYLTFEYVSVDMTFRTDYPWGYHITNKLRDDIYSCDDKPANGKVVARFWCDRVLPIIKVVEQWGLYYYTCQTERFYYNPDKLTFQSCLNTNQIRDYLGDKNGCAIHISKLEVFDRPKELSEFRTKLNIKGNELDHIIDCMNYGHYKTLTKAPQNYCYIEGE